MQVYVVFQSICECCNFDIDLHGDTNNQTKPVLKCLSSEASDTYACVYSYYTLLSHFVS